MKFAGISTLITENEVTFLLFLLRYFFCLLREFYFYRNKKITSIYIFKNSETESESFNIFFYKIKRYFTFKGTFEFVHELSTKIKQPSRSNSFISYEEISENKVKFP